MKFKKLKHPKLFLGQMKFKREFKLQLRSFIIVALGFTIAFSWRQTIFDISQSFVRALFGVKGTATLAIVTSTFITIWSVLLIYLASYLLKDEVY